MSKSISSRITVFLSVDQQTLNSYFNGHDPAPIYKRQLSHAFEQYIMSSIQAVKRYSVISYKVCYKNDQDKEYIDPLMYAIKGHFSERRLRKQAEFEKFKRRTYFLLLMSLCVLMLCQGLATILQSQIHQLSSGIINGLDVFSWVILWRPLDELIFSWNPHLKEISIEERLANADVILVKYEE